MECGQQVDNDILQTSSTPLVERRSSSISTTSSSAFSGTDGAPSSRTSSDGHWIDLVDHRLEHGRERNDEKMKNGNVDGKGLQEDWVGSTPEDRLTRVMEGQKRSEDGRCAHYMHLETTKVTSGLEVRTITSGHAKRLTHLPNRLHWSDQKHRVSEDTDSL
jgi:hypothetical protein